MGLRLPIKLLGTLIVVLGILVLVLLILLTASKISDVLRTEVIPREADRSSTENPTRAREEPAGVQEPAQPASPDEPRVAESFRGDPLLRGERVIFKYTTKDEYARESLYAIDLGTGQLSKVARDEVRNTFYESLDVSTDGEKLVFSDGLDLFIMNTDGTGLRVLFEDTNPKTGGTLGADMRPAFSPDGAQIAFERSVLGGEGEYAIVPNIYVVNVDGTGLRRVTSSEEDAYHHPDWTSDGQGLISLKERDAAKAVRGEPLNDYTERLDGLYATDLDGANERRFTDGFETRSDVVLYSPVADKVAFRSSDAFYVMSPDGGDREKAAIVGGPNSYPLSWSSDGTKLLVSVDGDLFIIDADGSRTTRLTESGTGGAPAAWTP